ncbi:MULTISPECIES: DNA polymerase III subunit gamma/tau [unclassified Sphingomonas]|uniref:DNA polymerase III subunit gamma/tau n=1 Tax=unclassified Sphingomonas TaxID=196159 RepID=UPI000BD24549|nr:MAG: DNA polymerase III subunit gamma/tau [Sphingomonas sp. 12-62-6]OYX39119.1 MAG: DNA polymerase III subunit gamma/tau [Sphingomonas sp. 32-62-10]
MADSFLDLGEPPQPAKAEAYRVLARKYRPQNFSELIGQDAMVTTLGNAIKRGRLAHAFLLTGVRGVGKTSTARLIAKALNCIGVDGEGGPTIDPCGVCEPCRAIAEGRHIDVIEMDAASHTGVDDVREIIDASRYSAVSARFKIYIIDEVHMLSKNAFNALLKTLEEPPPHVKFLFATTEVNKVPVTVLSRCQRFDLRRITSEKLAAHFAHVVHAEGVEAEPEALALIARAAEGSARDGLSILDQAIAHAGMEGGGVRADAVRDMLGLSDRGAVRALLGLVLAGDGRGALAALRRQYDLGVDPLGVLRALLESVHAVMLTKLGTEADSTQSAEERAALEEWAASLSYAALHRLWQLLLKGHEEVARAALPIEACEMALLRVIHAASLPDPGELARRLAEQGIAVGQPGAPTSPSQPVAPAPSAIGSDPALQALPTSFEAVLGMLDTAREMSLAEKLRLTGRVVRFEPPEIVLSSAKPFPADIPRELADVLRRLTGQNWRITTEDVVGTPSMREAQAMARESELDAVREAPIVKAVLEAFPASEIVEWNMQQRSAT